jgi:hypothetical protein
LHRRCHEKPAKSLLLQYFDHIAPSSPGGLQAPFVKPCEHRPWRVTTNRAHSFSYTEGNAMLNNTARREAEKQ